MDSADPEGRFFSVGGTVPLSAAYVVRPVDEQLFSAALAGEYCNVLTPRQMGKSSLMVRTMARLQQENVRTAAIDLTGIGSTELSAEQWYFGLVSRLRQQLGLDVDVNTWWNERAHQGAVQRFSDFMRDVILEEIAEPVVIFIDEIDYTLTMPFTDDFFAAIRAIYNARATDPTYNRLTFVLLGVAWPADLIKDRSRTPYNIGTSIDLRDFTLQEARMLLPGLEKAIPAEQADPVMKRVLHWTGGHPYLTQKVCAEIADRGDGRWTEKEVDGLIKDLFLSSEGRKETNIQYVIRRIQDSENREKLLRLYQRVLSGKPVSDEEQNPVTNHLKLTGLVSVTPQGTLSVRNRIYGAVFNRQWVRWALPQITYRGIAIATTAVAVVAIIAAAYSFSRLQILTKPPPPPAEATPRLYGTWTHKGYEMVMVYVPPGTFEMGAADGAVDERPVHVVTLDGFKIDQTEVSNAQYRQCVAEQGCSPPLALSSETRELYYDDPAYDDYPVINVEWFQAEDYCRWAGMRLPTEAEWEYAARGPDNYAFPWGDGEPEEALLNYNYSVGDTAQVGSYPQAASWCGVLDMAGNVSEWVADWYGDYPADPQVNPQGPPDGVSKVLRGGAWHDEAPAVRSTDRESAEPASFYMKWGFRCASGVE